MRGMGYVLVVGGLVALVAGLIAVARPFNTYFRENWPSMFGSLTFTLLGTFLGAMLALGVGWDLYRGQLCDQRDRGMAALLFESSQNVALLREVLNGKEWHTTSVGTSYPDSIIAESILGQPSLYLEDTDRGVVTAIAHYREQLDATRRMFDFMFDRFVAQSGELSKANLDTLRRICGNALASSLALQAFLDQYVREHKIRLGNQEQFNRYRKVLEEQREKVTADLATRYGSSPVPRP